MCTKKGSKFSEKKLTDIDSKPWQLSLGTIVNYAEGPNIYDKISLGAPPHMGGGSFFGDGGLQQPRTPSQKKFTSGTWKLLIRHV